VKAKGIGNIVNKIIAENFPKLGKEMSIQVYKASRTPNRHYETRTSPQLITVETISTENKERVLKAVKEKDQITCKGKLIKITADFSTESLK
jgi:hypothetical protein